MTRKTTTDSYNRRARLQPALFALLAVAVVALVLYPGLETRVATWAGIVAYFGGAAWLTQIGRERGKKQERKLYHHWGGMPSVALLRHRDTGISAITKNGITRSFRRMYPISESPTMKRNLVTRKQRTRSTHQPPIGFCPQQATNKSSDSFSRRT